MRRILGIGIAAVALSLSLLSPALAQTATEHVLYSFPQSNPGPGSLILASDGNFYGTTFGEGQSSTFGTIFRLTPAGVFSLVYTFTGGTDNEGPNSLVQGGDGYLYGTTGYNSTSGTLGTIFRVSLSGNFSTLHTFTGNDGSAVDSLIQGSDGNFYGTADTGGANNEGTIFKYVVAGNIFTVLHTLDGDDGNFADSPLVEATPGIFYSVAETGGDSNDGVLYSITSGGSYVALYPFCPSGDCDSGAMPVRALAEGPDGLLYGGATAGGANNMGSLFISSTTGGTSPLHSFDGSDGSMPLADKYFASDGNLYGTAAFGGANNMGSAYQLTTGGAFTLLYSFCSVTDCTDGEAPEGAGFIQDANGTLTSVVSGGGASGWGAVYTLDLNSPLAAPVQLSLSSGSTEAGSAVTLSWKVLNAFSTTLQQCYAFVQNTATGAGTWTGKQAGTYNSTTHLYTGSAQIVPTVAGTYTYALTCGGIESGFAALTVTASTKNSTSTSFAASPDPATVGQTVKFTATVTHAAGSAPPTGKVSFATAGETIGSANVNTSGVATLSAPTNGLPPGSYPIVATYSGDANYQASASAAVTVTLKKAATATTFTASPNPVTPPAKCTLTATVKRTASGAAGFATGTVTFSVGKTAIDSTALNAEGVATLSLSSGGTAAGNYPVTAKYNGDGSDTASSATVTVKVQ